MAKRTAFELRGCRKGSRTRDYSKRSGRAREWQVEWQAG